MTLSAALAAANSGLSITSRRASVTSNNIANATTPGYVRRELVQRENILGGSGNGVQLVGIDRAQDTALSRERRGAESSAARADVISRAYTDLNREMGAPGDSYGLFNAYQNVETSLRELSVTPESPAYQRAAYNSLNALTTQFAELQAIGTTQRVNADSAIARSVRDVNESLHKIDKLNGQIAGVIDGGDASALEDERQRLLDDISQIIPIKDIQRDNGVIDIVIEGGPYLLSGTVREISFTPSSVIPAGTTYTDGSGILSGLSVGGQDITPIHSSSGPTSGALAGYFAVRDEIAPEFLSQLDSLAADLVSRFSGSTVDPTNGATSAGILTDNGGPVDPANLAGIAGRLRINAAIDPNQGGAITNLRDGVGAVTTGPVGNSDILNNILQAFTDSGVAPTESGLIGNHTSSELVAGLSSLIGEARVHSDALAASSYSRATALSDLELSKTGVDTDAEMQNLMVIEQAYAANARVIQTVSEMLDILMQL